MLRQAKKRFTRFFHTLMGLGSRLSPESQNILKKTFADLTKYKLSPEFTVCDKNFQAA